MRPDFLIMLNTYKKTANDVVEKSLFERANGYEYVEETIEQEGEETYLDEDDYQVKTRPIFKKVKKVRKHMPADTTAIKYWLGNKMPKEWRDKTDVGVEPSADFAQLILAARKRAKVEDPLE